MLTTVHVSCALLSLGGFVVRGVLMMADSPLLRARAVRVVPHVVDTILLASAVALAWRFQQYPLMHSWLTAKVLALLFYIGLGSIGLHYGRTKPIRILAWLGAIGVFAYILAVARTRSATLWLF